MQVPPCQLCSGNQIKADSRFEMGSSHEGGLVRGDGKSVGGPTYSLERSEPVWSGTGSR